MPIDEPFHEGELFVQRRANEAKIAQRNGSVIAAAIPKGTLRFIGSTRGPYQSLSRYRNQRLSLR